MEAFLYELSKSVQGNMTFEEVLLLISAGAVSMYGRRKWKTLPFLYSIFLIVYITLLRRSPGYQEEIRLHLQFWTARGTADLNDIFSNGIGAATGAIVVCWIDRKGRTNREQKP